MSLKKSLSIYGFFTLIEKGIDFFLLPIFTYYLTTYDYGILANVKLLLSILYLFIALGGHHVLIIQYIHKKDTTFSTYLSSIYANAFISFLFIIASFILFQEVIKDFLSIPIFWVYLLPIMALFRVVIGMAFSYLQIDNQPKRFGLLSLGNLVLSASISLLLIVYYEFNYTGRLWSELMSGSLLAIGSLVLFYKSSFLTKKPSFTFMKEVIIIGLPLTSNALSHLVMNSLDRFFISKMVSIEATGIYQVGYAVGSIILLVSMLFYRAWTPILYRYLAKEEQAYKIKIVKVSLLFLLSLGGFLPLLSFILSPFVFNHFIDAKFSTGQHYVFLIGLSYFWWAVFQVFGNVLYYYKRVQIFLRLGIFNVVVNAILNYILIAQFGTIGAVYATLASFMLLAFIVMIYSHRYYPLPWREGLHEIFQLKI
ncbi:MAG: lipopolysaccharide biosynthesis protein [Saprospiraceae bacterium]